MQWIKVLKANPYHDELGRFSTGDKAKFVSIGGIFDKQRQNAKLKAKQKPVIPKRDFKDRSDDTEFSKVAEAYLLTLNKTQGAAVYKYTGESYEDINSHLRTGGVVSLANKKAIEQLDKALNGSSIPADTITYRGVQDEYASKLRSMHRDGSLVGSVIKDEGYSSTSVNKSVAERWTGKNGVYFEVNVPKDSKGLYVGYHPTQSKFTKFPNERELILPRSGTLTVNKVREESGNMVITADWTH